MLCLWLWLMHLDFFYNQTTTRRKRWVIYIYLFRKKRNHWNMFYGGVWYSTRNDTLVIPFYFFMHIIGRKFLCSYIIKILLTLILRCGLIIWSLLWYTIIVGGTVFFMRALLPFCIIFTIEVGLMLYKYSQKRKH